MPKSLKNKRLGEARVQNCGLEATITKYVNANDITVKFPDGVEVKHRGYNKFIRGGIKYPTKTNRIGQSQMQNCGLIATIIKYENWNNITIRFSDGTIVKNKIYQHFIKGHIKHPDIRTPCHRREKTDRTGETRMMRCGMEAKITEYITARNITIEFSDKTILEHRYYDSFVKGEIDHPNINRYRLKKEEWYEEHIGETQRQSCGLDGKIIDCKNSHNMTVLFPDGTIVKNKKYSNFEKGLIGHPTISGRFKSPIGKIHPNSKSKIYHTRVFGIAHHDPNSNACYYAHCPICGAHAIWTFETIKNHECNRELVKERDTLIQELTADIKEDVA